MENDYKIIKETHRWTRNEKIKWLGYGEWVEEADDISIEYLGYQAAIRRIIMRDSTEEEAYFGGYFCGYVCIPSTHSYFKKQGIDLECHGGITFNEAHEEHWIGFDCAHAGDLIPTCDFLKRNIDSMELIKGIFPIPDEFADSPLFHSVYRNIEYCINECIGIINQLVEIDSKMIKPIQ